MGNPNQHIINYLKYYLNDFTTPGFAVMLTGGWGCGKTWFVKNFIKNYCDKDTLYISLYGIESTDEIDNIIFMKLHPIISSKLLSIAGKLTKGMLKGALHLDLDGVKEDKADIEISAPNISIKEIVSPIKNKKIIFDDFERCRIATESLMGYINSFVEHKGLKVILVGDEEKLNTEEKNYFLSRKEKIIGHSYQIAPLIENALEKFINEITEPQCQKFLESKKQLIIEEFNCLGYNNLRDLRQAMLGFEYFFENIDHEYRAETEFLSKLLSVYMYLTLELKAGYLTKENWKKALATFKRERISQKKFCEMSKKHQQEELSNHIWTEMFSPAETPLLGEWEEVIFEGRISYSKINEAMRNSKYFLEKNKTTLAILISESYSLSPSNFKEKIELLWEEIKQNWYKHPGDILHILDTLLLFSSKGLIEESVEKIAKEIERTIEELALKDELTFFEFGNRNSIEEFGGYGFSQNNKTIFIHLYNLLRNKLDQKKRTLIETQLNDCLSDLPKKFSLFCQLISSPHRGNKWGDCPVLSWLDIEKFYNNYIGLNQSELWSFIAVLEDRYEMRFSNGQIKESLASEIDFLASLFEKVKNKISTEGLLHRPDNHKLKEINNDLEKIINHLKQKVIPKNNSASS